MATETLMVKITANAASLTNELDKISKKLNETSKKFDGLNKIGDGMKNVGKKLTMGLTVPIAGVGAVSAKTAMDFEAGMNKVSAISGATGKDLDKLSDLAKKMGSETKFSATESAEALSYMSMAGWKTQDMLEGLPSILDLAAAGGTDLALASDIVTDGLTGLGLSAKDTQMFVDTMAATISNSNTSIELMGETLKYVAPVAGALGIDMKDLSLAIGLMGNAGIKGSAAGTALRAGLTNLVKPTKEMAGAMSQYGVELVKNKDGSIDLMGTMENLRSTLGGLDEATQAQALASIFGKEAMSAWAAIVNASEGDFNKLSSAIANSDGTAQKMSDTMMKGAKGALVEMKSALEGVAITIGERLSPFIEKAADFVSNLCNKFKELNPTTQTFIMIVAGVAAALGPLLLLAGSLVKGFAALSIATGGLTISVGALVVPFLIVTGVIAGVIAAGVLLCQNWDQIKSWAINLGNTISEVFSSIGTWIGDTWNNVIEWTTTTWNNIVTFLSGIWENICNVVTTGIMFIGQIISAGFQIITLPFQFIWQNCKDFLIEIWNGITTYLSNVWSNISSKCSEVWNSIKNFLTNIWNSIKSTCTPIFEGLKNFISNVWNNIKNTASNIWNSIKSSLSNTWSSIKSTATNLFNQLKTSITNVWNSLKSVTSSVWNSIKDAIKKPIDLAKEAVSSAIEKMKSILSVTLPFPKIKLPHFSISGKFSLNPPSIPKFSVDWYSKGAIFKRPTVLGGVGVGDAHRGIGSNAEAVLPINKLPQLLGLDKQQGGNLSLNIENFNNNREQDIKELVEEIAFYLRRKNIAIGR